MCVFCVCACFCVQVRRKVHSTKVLKQIVKVCKTYDAFHLEEQGEKHCDFTIHHEARCNPISNTITVTSHSVTLRHAARPPSVLKQQK